MKKGILSLLLFVFVFGAIVEYVDAQPRRRGKQKKFSRGRGGRSMAKRSKYWSFGGGIGFNNYFGDLSPSSGIGSSSFNVFSPYVGAQAIYRFHPHFSGRFNLGWQRIGASDANAGTDNVERTARTVRNLHFRNDIFEAAAILETNLFPVARGAFRRAKINPYAFIGLSLFTNNPMAKGPNPTFSSGLTPVPGNFSRSNEWIALHDLKTEAQGNGGSKAYSTVQIGMPLGIGVKYAITKKLDLSFEIGYRLSFSNYLDDVGGANLDMSQANISTLDPLTVRMSNRTAEVFNAAGESRLDLVRNNSANGSLIRSVTLSDGSTFTYIAGNEKGQSPRGGVAPDYYLTTAFHLTYVMGKSYGAPRRRR